MEKKLKIILSAGGTGGHIMPACKLADGLLQHDADVFFAAKGLKNNRSFQDSFPYKEIAASSLKNKWRFFLNFIIGFCQSLWLMLKIRPHVVVGFGSFHSFPVLCAAFLTKRKIILFEPNTFLGKVNRLFAPLAKTVAIQFPIEQKIKNSKYIRPLSWHKIKELEKKTIREKLNIKEDALVVLVFGGSQGATFINALCFEAFTKLLWPLTVINITGSDEETAIYEKKYKEANINAIVKTFEKGLDELYTAADFSVCRCGAATSAELIYFSMPSIVIPYPHAMENHQEKNGKFLETEVKGSMLVVQDKAYDIFMDRLLHLLKHLDEYRDNIRKYKNKMKAENSFIELIVQAGGGK
jgi:UDP-N-acetylglucosamine--N-acetylmuramyl-(pentapeptide) pyrophosphoryl-undecaprenol N-acetylglucosamine transferase